MSIVQWTDELKASIVEQYISQDPTEENTVEIAKEIVNNYNATSDAKITTNGVRLILTTAGVYIKKEAKPTAKKGGKPSKADAIEMLDNEITRLFGVVDTDLTSKFTGKGACYITELLGKVVLSGKDVGEVIESSVDTDTEIAEIAEDLEINPIEG